jgi:hypothetical protein
MIALLLIIFVGFLLLVATLSHLTSKKERFQPGYPGWGMPRYSVMPGYGGGMQRYGGGFTPWRPRFNPAGMSWYGGGGYRMGYPGMRQVPQYGVQVPQYGVQVPQYGVQVPQYGVQVPPQHVVQVPAPAAPATPVAEPEQKVVTVPAPEKKAEPAPAPEKKAEPAPEPDFNHSHSDGTTTGDGTMVPLGPDDIPYLDPHQSTKADPKTGFFGFPMNRTRLNTIAEKLNMIGPDGFAKSLSRLGIISEEVPGSEHEKTRRESAIYSAMATAAKLTLLPIQTVNEATGSTCFTGAPAQEGQAGGCDGLSKCYGRLKGFAMQSNVAKVKEVLKTCGGSQKNLSNDELIYLWGLNEHHNLHCCSFSDPQGHQLHHASHLTSLNDYAMLGSPECGGDDKPKKCTVGDEEITIRCEHPKPWAPGSYDNAKGNSSICTKGWMGFHNDTGMWPEWPAIKAAFTFVDKVKPYKS